MAETKEGVKEVPAEVNEGAVERRGESALHTMYGLKA